MNRLIALRDKAAAPDSDVGFYEASMLLAKTYAAWPQHTPDALAVYDDLIQKSPQDFRCRACFSCSLSSYALQLPDHER